MKTLLQRIAFVCFIAELCVSNLVADSNPVTLTLDLPYRQVMVPISDSIVLTFSGTIVVAPGLERFQAGGLTPYNYEGTANLNTPRFAPSFLDFHTGTYTGPLFTVEVSPLTLPDLYAYVGSIELGVPITFWVNVRDPDTGAIAGEASRRYAMRSRSRKPGHFRYWRSRLQASLSPASFAGKEPNQAMERTADRRMLHFRR
jgi:hypothetical protein